MTTVPVAAQAVGVLAVFVGLFLLLPTGWFALAAGVLLVVGGAALEFGQGRVSGRQDRRGGPVESGAGS